MACQVLSTVPATDAAATRRTVEIANLLRLMSFAHPIAGRRRARLDRLVLQVPAQIGRQPVGRFIAPVAVLLDRLHHDPVQLSPHQPAQLLRLDVPARRDRGQPLGRREPHAWPR